MTQNISWLSLSWCLLPIMLMCGIYVSWCGKVSVVLIASARMALQLCLIGYALVILFATPSILVSVLTLCFMLIVASWISIRPIRQHQGCWFPALIALAVSVFIHLGISIFLVLNTKPWYQPTVIIPLAGMYFANSMNTVSLAAERYYAELHAGVNDDRARITAFQAALIPQINGLFAVGLVSLPGMMTGQILSGVSPLIAVRYQILIMAMLFGTSGLSAALMLWQLKFKNTPS